jgi:hypothetical protein
MRKITLLSTAILGTMLTLVLHAEPAQAQSLRTWVASNGTNNATCGRTTPCATFTQAHAATAAGGEINCVDAGDYGGVTINKSISIICDNTQAGASASLIHISGGTATDIITLQGLNLDGNGGGTEAIRFASGAALHVQNVKIRNFRNNSDYRSGILFVPSSYAELYVSDSTISGNGTSSPFNGGIVISPTATGSVNAFISRVRIENNAAGIIADGSRSTGLAVNAVVIDSTVVGSATNGIAAMTTASHAAVTVFVDHSVVSGNFGSGINANGATAQGAGSALVRIGDSTIVNNVTGVSTTGAGVAQSFKNNRISANLSDGTPIAAFPGPGGTPLQ